MTTIHDLLGAYCTDALEPDERADFEDHLTTCTACRVEAHQLREVLAALAETTPEAPPADLEDQVVSAARSRTGGPASAGPPAGTSPRTATAGVDRPITEPSSDVPSDAVGPERTSELQATPRGWARGAPWLAAAAASAVFFAAGVGLGRAQAPEADAAASAEVMSSVVAVASAPDAHVMAVDMMGTTSRVLLSEQMDSSVFLASDLPMPARGMTYQVWRVTGDGEMVSAGTFTPDADGHIAVVLEGGSGDVVKFMITLEPPGGSDRPTGQMLGEVAT